MLGFQPKGQAAHITLSLYNLMRPWSNGEATLASEAWNANLCVLRLTRSAGTTHTISLPIGVRAEGWGEVQQKCSRCAAFGEMGQFCACLAEVEIQPGQAGREIPAISSPLSANGCWFRRDRRGPTPLDDLV